MTQEPSTGVDAAGATWCCELELAAAPRLVGVLPQAGAGRTRVLVRLHGEPLGYLTDTGDTDAATFGRQARDRFTAGIAAHLAAEGAAPAAGDEQLPAATAQCLSRATSTTSVSVVVCTRDRAETLAGCIERLRALTHPALEVLVVDNAPSDDSTRRLVEATAAADPRFRYVTEPRPGLSRARNRGLAEALGEVIAYTDDDVAVDPGWVQGLLRGFARPGVGCVTGLVATAGIGSRAEEYFDARTALWSTRVEPQLYDMGEHRPADALYPYAPGLFGTGANFAFDRAFLLELGGFDEALGAGARTRGGEDLDVFVRVLLGGRALAYEPAAVVWHHHRADDAALLRQLYGYGSGLSAYLTKCLLSRSTRGELLRRVPAGLRRGKGISDSTTQRLGETATAPAGAARRELAGFVAGPVLYLSARRAARR